MANNLHACFRAQYGLIHRSQVHRIGMTDRQIERRLATGSWLLERPGVYRLAGVPRTWESDLLAAMLGREAVASHRSAAVLWDLGVYQRPRPELSVPIDRRYGNSGDRARVHTTTQWVLRDATIRRGIACTGIERTLLDCCAVVGLRRAERLAESAIRQQLTTWTDLARCLMRHSRRGRNGCGTLRALLETRLGSPVVPLSDFSRLVANLLIDEGLPEPVLEFPIIDATGDHVLAVDLAWPRQRKAWELDGLAYHFGRTDIERDKRKRNRAMAEGWTIQEILWSMYVNEPDQLVAMARKFLTT